MEIIYLPKPASNTFCHFIEIPFLASPTNLHELFFLPQPLLGPLYLLDAFLPEEAMMKGGGTPFSSLDSRFPSLSQPPSLPSAFQSIQGPLQLLPMPPPAARHKSTRVDMGKPRMPAKVALWSAWQGIPLLTPRPRPPRASPARQSMPLDVRSMPAGCPLAPAPSSLSCSSR